MEVAIALTDEFIHQPLRRADRHKATDHQGHAVRDHCDGILYRDSFIAEPTRCCTIWNSSILVSSKVGDVDADQDKLDKSGKVSAADQLPSLDADKDWSSRKSNQASCEMCRSRVEYHL